MPNATYNVLITTPQWQSALACIQSLGGAGHRIFLWGEAEDHPNLHSDHVTRFLVRKGRTPEEQVAELARIVVALAIDLVIPISDQDAAVAAALNASLGSSICVVGSPAAVAAVRDRNRTAEMCRRLGIPTPRSLPATRVTALSVAQDIGYPCFLKFSGTLGSHGVTRVASPDDVARRLNAVPESTAFQIQEEITGKLSDVTGFAIAGELVDSFAFETDYDQSHGGNPAYAREVHDGRLVDILRKLVDELDWTGGIDVDLLTDSRDRHYVLEINPRLSGTAVFALKTGIDLPQRYLEALGGGTPARPARSHCESSTPRCFVSVLEEQHYLSSRAGSTRDRAASGDMLNNLFPDDAGYSRAIRKRLALMRLKHRYPRAFSIFSHCRDRVRSLRG